MGLDLHGNKLPMLVILLTLAVCALFTARGTTNLLAAKLLPLDGSAGGGGEGEAEGALPGDEVPDMMAILKRNIFDPSTGPLPKPDAPEPVAGDDDVAPEELAPGQMPPPCDGAVKLVASVHSERAPQWSFATLDVGAGDPMLYREGAKVEGKEVAGIYPKAIFLREGNGRLCSVTMFVADKGKKSGAKRPKRPREEPDEAPKPPKRRAGKMPIEELEQNIQKVSDTKYNVNRSLIDKVLANQAELMRSARIVPHEQNGQVVGVKLYGIRRKSLLGQLGLQNGDLLKTINGYDMSSPDAALEAYTRLRSAGDLTVSVTRRGRAMNLEYQVQE